jgi:hypothetical protein
MSLLPNTAAMEKTLSAEQCLVQAVCEEFCVCRRPRLYACDARLSSSSTRLVIGSLSTRRDAATRPPVAVSER